MTADIGGMAAYFRDVSVEAVRDQPMTWREYESLGEDDRGEYIDGCSS